MHAGNGARPGDRGGYLLTNKAFDPTTGWLKNQQCGFGDGACSQNETYTYDPVGNLTQRQNNNLGLTESFFYDNVYRLDHSTLNGITNLQMSYDAMGNIKGRIKDIHKLDFCPIQI